MSPDPTLKPARELAALTRRRFPNETDAYREARVALLAEEIELRRHVERVAAQRRALSLGGEVPEDYTFVGESGPVKLSALFGPHDTLVTYNWMFGPQRERPCPMCTCLLGALDGESPDIVQKVGFAVIARSPIERLTAFKRERGWRHLPVVSSGANDFNRLYADEDPAKGEDNAGFCVFKKEGGRIFLTYADEMASTWPTRARTHAVRSTSCRSGTCST